jgi:hypothetical protein
LQAKKQPTHRIQLSIPVDWLAYIDGLVEIHAFGAKTRQDVILAFLAEMVKTIKEKEKA